jgi:hypothetical protein
MEASQKTMSVLEELNKSDGTKNSVAMKKALREAQAHLAESDKVTSAAAGGAMHIHRDDTCSETEFD